MAFGCISGAHQAISKFINHNRAEDLLLIQECLDMAAVFLYRLREVEQVAIAQDLLEAFDMLHMDVEQLNGECDVAVLPRKIGMLQS